MGFGLVGALCGRPLRGGRVGASSRASGGQNQVEGVALLDDFCFSLFKCFKKLVYLFSIKLSEGSSWTFSYIDFG